MSSGVRVRRSLGSKALRGYGSALLLAALVVLPGVARPGCPGKVAVQVLGSGGPVADDARAASGYLLWLDGHARLLVDAGGGVFLRFGEAGADIADLDAVVLTHMHTDHAADLPALLKGGYFSDRTRPLPVLGPGGRAGWPGVDEFLRDLFAPEHGAFRYLAGFLDGSDGLFAVPPTDVDPDSREPVTAFANARLRVQAVGVRHGPVPALGLVVEAGGRRIAFSGDQNDDNPQFARLIDQADILFMDHAIPQDAGPAARGLHATPRHIGQLAAGAGVGRLVLSHLMARSLPRLDESRRLIRESFGGPLDVAADLACYTLSE